MAATAVIYNRQSSIFDQARFTKKVDVIGAGATGSHVVYTLAKMGVQKIRVFDFDTVAEHNIPNQLFGLADVGSFKVDALKKRIKDLCDIDIEAVNAKIEPPPTMEQLEKMEDDGVRSEHYPYVPGDIVFLLTDTMKSRREIFETFLQRSLTQLLIETRMGLDSGRIYTIRPGNATHAEKWLATLYSDAEAEVSLCGSSTAIACTAVQIAAMAVWQMLRYSKGAPFDNEQIFSLDPLLLAIQGSFN